MCGPQQQLRGRRRMRIHLPSPLHASLCALCAAATSRHNAAVLSETDAVQCTLLDRARPAAPSSRRNTVQSPLADTVEKLAECRLSRRGAQWQQHSQRRPLHFTRSLASRSKPAAAQVRAMQTPDTAAKHAMYFGSTAMVRCNAALCSSVCPCTLLSRRSSARAHDLPFCVCLPFVCLRAECIAAAA